MQSVSTGTTDASGRVLLDDILRLAEDEPPGHVNALEADGLIGRQGHRRSTRWFPA